MKPLTAAALYVLTLMSTAALAQPFCEIVRNGAKFDRKVVQFRSLYGSAPEDFGSFFYEESNCGTIDDITPNSRTDKSVRRFYAAVEGTLPSNFSVDVTGVFHWNKSWRPALLLSAVMKPGPHGELEITHVWHYRELRP